LNAFVSDVTVCATLPSFVQQTVVPGATVFVDGEKRKSRTSMVVSPASHVTTVGSAEAHSAAAPGSATRRAAATAAVSA
jgi:hypothetical protein